MAMLLEYPVQPLAFPTSRDDDSSVSDNDRSIQSLRTRVAVGEYGMCCTVALWAIVPRVPRFFCQTPVSTPVKLREQQQLRLFRLFNQQLGPRKGAATGCGDKLGQSFAILHNSMPMQWMAMEVSKAREEF